MNQAAAPAASSGTPFPRTPQIIFANWREALHNGGQSPGIQTVYCMAVQGYLDYCAHNAISLTTESARAYMDDVTRRGCWLQIFLEPFLRLCFPKVHALIDWRVAPVF